MKPKTTTLLPQIHLEDVSNHFCLHVEMLFWLFSEIVKSLECVIQLSASCAMMVMIGEEDLDCEVSFHPRCHKVSGKKGDVCTAHFKIGHQMQSRSRVMSVEMIQTDKIKFTN